MARRVDLALAILNGLVGDYLHRTRNGLATEMTFVQGGVPVAPDAAGLARAFPAPTPRVVVLVHGLMCDERCWEMPDGADYGTLLQRDLGMTPVYLRYNSGRAVADNGAALERQLGALVEAYPAPMAELVLVGYSMGGLVVRSACGQARARGAAWLQRVRRAIYVGTPHLGAPLERGGKVVARLLGAAPDPYTRLVGQIAELRSQGVKDLGPASPVPLVPELAHFLVAGSLSADPRLAALLGDAMVPLVSATDGACTDLSPELPPAHVRLFPGVSHVELARHPEVYAELRRRCEEPR